MVVLVVVDDEILVGDGSGGCKCGGNRDCRCGGVGGE